MTLLQVLDERKDKDIIEDGRNANTIGGNALGALRLLLQLKR